MQFFIKGLINLLLVFATVTYAQAKSYFPPERINCHLNATSSLTCEELNRKYLIEDTTNMIYQKGLEEVFHFISAIAYVEELYQQASIFYTYHNSMDKVVKLKNASAKIYPSLEEGGWQKVGDKTYYCEGGYLTCGVRKIR